MIEEGMNMLKIKELLKNKIVIGSTAGLALALIASIVLLMPHDSPPLDTTSGSLSSGNSIPVSYTHLDVYKRQFHSIFI